MNKNKKSTTRTVLHLCYVFLFIVTVLQLTTYAQKSNPPVIPETNSSYIDANGTAHVTRVVPVPTTISPEAQKFLTRKAPDLGHMTLEERRKQTDIWQAARGDKFRSIYPVNIALQTIAAVPVKIITPAKMPERNRDKVLINLHGGGFDSDSGSLTETIPIAYLTQTKVVAVLYRLMPEHPFPAAVDDTVAVYKQLLKTYQPQHICLYGTSAGAILTPQVAVRLRQTGLPLPACMGVFSGLGDFSQRGDSQSIFGLFGLTGPLNMPQSAQHSATTRKVVRADPRDPERSPIFADLKGFPPTLFLTSERDMLLSGTINLHRAFLRAGVDARLVVFEGLPHAFWNHPGLPETKEADETMSHYFSKQLGLASR